VVDRLEKIGRFALWVALAALCVLMPIGMHRQHKETTRLVDQAREELAKEKKQAADKEKDKENEKKPKRLSIKTMGPFLSGMDGATGHVWFTNASARSGVVCLQGSASRQGTDGVATAIPACELVGPYVTNVKMSLLFAGGEVRAICPNGDCTLSVKDAPEEVAAAK
jgi:hypothetical protein